MLKRKHWNLDKGDQDGSSDDESSSGSEAAEENVGVESSDDEEGSGDEGAAEIRRLEDLSEDDFEQDDPEALQAEAVSVKELWLTASKENADTMPRAALACRLCKGVLMIGPVSLKQHLESSRHLSRLKKRGADFEPITFAMGHQDDSTVETHQERLNRTRELLQQSKAAKTRRARRRELKLKKQQKKGKPGKRERAELKAAQVGGQTAKGHDNSAPKAKATPDTADETGSQPKSKYWSTPQPPGQKKRKAKHQLPRSGQGKGQPHFGRPNPVGARPKLKKVAGKRQG